MASGFKELGFSSDDVKECHPALDPWEGVNLINAAKIIRPLAKPALGPAVLAA